MLWNLHMDFSCSSVLHPPLRSSFVVIALSGLLFLILVLELLKPSTLYPYPTLFSVCFAIEFRHEAVAC